MPFLELEDEIIINFIEEDIICDAFTQYILNNFTNPRMKTQEVFKNSNEISNHFHSFFHFLILL
jgi:hypothetical protein